MPKSLQQYTLPRIVERGTQEEARTVLEEPRTSSEQWIKAAAMYQFTANTIGVDELRVRLVKMSNADLLRSRGAAAAICSPEANLGKSSYG